jgi:hypothetical protein
VIEEDPVVHDHAGDDGARDAEDRYQVNLDGDIHKLSFDADRSAQR